MGVDIAGHDLSELIDLLDKAISVLDRHGETHWAAWLTTSKHRLVARDAYGITQLLRAYGGVGSFNDLVIAEANNHSIDVTEEHAVNDNLDALRTVIWRIATELEREVGI